MVRLFYYCLFLPVSLLVAMCTDTSDSYKFVCMGNSTELFQNITTINLKTDFFIFKSLGKSEDMASRLNSSYDINDKYQQKVFWENTTLLLHNFEKSDEGNYVIYYNHTKRNDIRLCALDPPKSLCTIDIKQTENSLIAYLNNPTDCGQPLVNVIWMHNNHLSLGNTAILQLPSGNQTGTYIACMDGKTLKCLTGSQVRNTCKNYSVGLTLENTSPTITEPPNLLTAIFAVIGVVIFGVFIGIAILIKLCWMYSDMKKKLFARRPRGAAVRRLGDPLTAQDTEDSSV